MLNSDGGLFLLAIAILLSSAKAFGALARGWNQPAVVGEIVAGVLLGPTLLGRLAPDFQSAIFPSTGPRAELLHALNEIGIIVFLFMAGAEIDVAGVARRARAALAVAAGGMLAPLLLGAGLAALAPQALGWDGSQPRWLFALFLGTALCISALPVIARTLLDLGIYRSDLGMTVMAAAVLNDLVGWLLFAFIIGNLPTSEVRPSLEGGLLAIAVALILWAVGRPLVHHVLSRVHRRTHDPASALAFMMPLLFLGAAASETFGLHAMFGALLVGATAAGSPHFREQTRSAVQDFVSVFFAPLFFASIGLEADFVRDFDASLVAILFVLACLGKILGCGAGARIAGIASHEAWAIGFAMNARGAMEIVLALAAREAGLIGPTTFVALTVMALATSMLSGPMIGRMLPPRRGRGLLDAFEASRFVPALAGRNADEAIRELTRIATAATALDPSVVAHAVLEREALFSTAIGEGVATPHGRLSELTRPVVAVGVAGVGGMEWDAPDGIPVRIVFLVLTPSTQDGAQVEILADIATCFADPHAVERLVEDPRPGTLVALAGDAKRDRRPSAVQHPRTIADGRTGADARD